MTRAIPRFALAGALLLVLAVPTHAQGDTSSVRFDGVGFEFSHRLGRSVNITQVPRQRPGAVGEGEASPAHVTFSLYRRMTEARRPPGPFGVPGTVRVYATSSLEGYRLATRQLERLQGLLAERPDPASLEEMSEQLSVDLPYLPIPEAGQPLAARVEYIDTPELSGVAYVTGFRQDVFPFARDDFWYTFQGLSADGQWYVSVNWVVRATMFPARVSNADARRVGRNARTFARYIRQSVNTLDAAEPSAFRPSLETLDALVRSIDFESVVAPGASPSPAPTASPPPPDGVPASEGPVASPVASAAPSAPPASVAP